MCSASYGKQLSRIGDALVALLNHFHPRTPLTEEEAAAIDDLSTNARHCPSADHAPAPDQPPEPISPAACPPLFCLARGGAKKGGLQDKFHRIRPHSTGAHSARADNHTPASAPQPPASTVPSTPPPAPGDRLSASTLCFSCCAER
jgi:hypothetical protein